MKEYCCLSCNKKTVRSRLYHKPGKYCDNVCQQAYQNKIAIAKWIQGKKVPSLRTIKRYLSKLHTGCWICHTYMWLGQELVLELDHVDGNARNNKPKNLRLLCSNCHSQTPTFKNRNKGKGRTTLGLR